MIELFLWITMIVFVIGVPWLCLQSTHRREKKEIKETGHVRNTWNPKEY